MKIKLPGELFPWQEQVEAANKRFTLIEGGRQAGKTHFSVRWIIRQACKTPAVHWHLSPTYKRAVEDVWPALLKMVPPEIRKKVHLSNHSISLINGSRIYIKSSDDPKNLRGGNLGSGVMEEADYQRDMVFNEILRPMLMYRTAPCLMISSPRPDWFHRLWLKVNRGEMGDDWGAWHVTVYDNPKLKREEIEGIRLSESDRVWRREYLAEPLEDEGRMYPEFQEASIFETGQKFDSLMSWPVCLGADWGRWDDPAAFAFLHISPNGKIVLNEEYIQGNLDVESHCVKLKALSHGLNIKRRALSWDAFSRNGDNRLTVADRFRMSGVPFTMASKKKDGGIDLMKRVFRGWGGEPWFYVNSKCRNFLKHVREAEYEKHEPDILSAVRHGVYEIIQTGMTGILTLPKIEAPIEPYTPKLTPHRFRKTPLRWNFSDGVPA